VCDPNELWSPDLDQAERFRCVYDPEIQRGQKESKSGKLTPALNKDNIDSMIQDIRRNEFECPELMWNLRFGKVLWVYVRDRRELRIYEGVATRPDTNHRHHAIIQMHRAYRKWHGETGSEVMDQYNPKRPYALAIYSDGFEGEAHKFYVLNSKGQKVPPGKAHFVAAHTSDPHLHAKLAKDVMYASGVLGHKNVEIVQSTISKNSAKLVLFYTLVRGLQAAFPTLPAADTGEYQQLVQHLVEFVGELNAVRPNEIATLSLDKRQKARSETIADQAITWIAYFRLCADLRNDPQWKKKLAALGQPYATDGYSGDVLSRENPLWVQRGILAPDQKGQLKVVSNRNAQDQLVAALREIVAGAATVAAAA
jgi:hypothetical protein